MKPVVSYKNVSIAYEKDLVIDDFSMEVNQNEKIVLSGPSGSGKSTLVNALMGFVKIKSGEIILNGLSVNPKNIVAIRKQIAWLPQASFFDYKYCKDLVYFPFSFEFNKKLTPSSTEMQNMLTALLLPNDILEKQVDEISGGQKQRLLLASILLLKRNILILDEPTSALDNESTEKVLEVIKKNNCTVISTSHDPFWNGKMDRIIKITE